MELIAVNYKNRKIFLDFYRSQYINNPLRRDALSDLVKGLIYGKSELCKSLDLEPYLVMDHGKIIMICILAYARRMPDYLQIGFFESSEYNMEAFMLIMKRAEEFAAEKGATKISGSLNIHVNYGLGFLASDYDKEQSFGLAHNQEFYHRYFAENCFKTIEMVTYKKNITNKQRLLNPNIRDKIETKYKVRELYLSNLKSEIALYTRINNEAFANHLFYYPRKEEEDFELFKELKYLLKSENLLFVEKAGVPVGFMLWYPDFNMLIKPGEKVGLKTVIRNKIFPNKIRTLKLVEMGVVPGEQGRGAILALFNYCFKCTKGRFDYVESGWILTENTRSKNFGVKWADGESKLFKAYIKDLNDEKI